jgi:hypothetical protein
VQRLPAASDAANYGFLRQELMTSERGALPAVMAAHGLAAQVQAFEMHFERAGVKNYPSRLNWAQIALDVWHARPVPAQPRGLLAALIDLILKLFKRS